MFRIRDISSKALLAAGLTLALAVPLGSAQANGVNILYVFVGASGGANPNAGLTVDEAGSLYGTTFDGGASNLGTVFKLAPDGTESVLHSFAGGSDGAQPFGGLTMDAKGNLYSTTYSGGAGACSKGCGTVFKLTPDGRETVLYSFAGGSDGANPFSSLIVDAMGNLYGTTYAGGGSCNCGIVFKLTPQGTESVLHAFSGRDGANPLANPILDAMGNLYGTTGFGGVHGQGTVFKLTPQGKESVLYSFAGGGDGAFLRASLIMDKRGNLYGTTAKGGDAHCGDGCGTVFKLTPKGKKIVLHFFTGAPRDGEQPFANLIADQQGNFYSTTIAGGAHGAGTVFKIAVDGAESTLYAFTGGADGAQPIGGLIADKKGNLYGTSSISFAGSYGAVFKVKN